MTFPVLPDLSRISRTLEQSYSPLGVFTSVGEKDDTREDSSVFRSDGDSSMLL